MHTADPADEYLHEPNSVRLWNESYYFGFADEELAVSVRLGYQPFEERANVWLFVHDIPATRTYCYRDETVPTERVHGHHVQTDPLSLSLAVVEPNREWQIDATAACTQCRSVREVFDAAGRERAGDTRVAIDLAYQGDETQARTERRSERKQKTTQPGRFRGTINVDGTTHDVDAAGFRDHSWGGQRNWTPVAGGYFWYTVRVPGGHALKLAAYLDPAENLTVSPIGFHTDGETVRPVQDASVVYDDGRSPEARLAGWLAGDVPDEFAVDLAFDDGEEGLVFEPHFANPLGYEDRNWATADLDSEWLTAVVFRLPVRVRWRGSTGGGWFEAMHPRVRVDTDNLGSEGL